MLASKFDNTEDRKILLAPEQARYRPNEILFERSDGSQFGNNLLMQFPDGVLILAREDGSRGIGPVLEGGMRFFESD